MIILESEGISDVGKKRKGNEDFFFIDDDMGLYVVADGMGGHNAGEVASRIVADGLRDQMIRFAGNLDEDQLVQTDETLPIQARRLAGAIHIANAQVYEKAKSDPAYKGMGSTVSAIYFTDRTIISGNVGDSPIYLIRDNKIRLLSVLHTMMAEYEAMAPNGAKNLSEQFRHMITRAMGIDATVKPDLAEIPVKPDDIIVISSDGMTDKIPPEEIRDLASRQKNPGKLCRTLVDLANERGGDDNITVIVLRIVDITDSPPESPDEKPADHREETTRRSPLFPVNIDTEDASFSAFIHHIDTKGAFIETSDPFAEGSEIDLTVSDPNDKHPFMVVATVGKRRSKGIEVTFHHLSDEKKRMIEGLMKNL